MSNSTIKDPEEKSDIFLYGGIGLGAIVVLACVAVVIYSLYKRRRSSEMATAMVSAEEEEEEEVATVDEAKRMRDGYNGDVVVYHFMFIKTLDGFSLTIRLHGVVNATIITEPNKKNLCMLYFEAAAAPEKRIKVVHQLVHRLNDRKETALGTLACKVMMPEKYNVNGKEVGVTHECPRGSISHSKQKLDFMIYDYAGIPIPLYVTARPAYVYAIEIGTKMLQCLYVLHSESYCHGRLTPSCFYIDEDRAQVTLLDLGFLHPLKIPTDHTKYYKHEEHYFNATYQSAASHNITPPSICGDLESWCFIFVEIFTGKPLPWVLLHDKRSIQDMKNLFNRDYELFYDYTKDIRPEMVRFLREIVVHVTTNLQSELNDNITVKYQSILDSLSQLDQLSEKHRIGENHNPTSPACSPFSR
ncbi:unnamed protein product [Bursaphelenchus okinawaensis]|uniref:Protein kinase domain-containing protein n=1 Tax=Bursaphelenchus okinawaensis TaxID=465554 RepID=A0A811L9V2_9BILA|nr:unnamed protein product [Bursaphelenchus okinawaensis]CAG9121750.1 unnamed protein product [Bursaphelenchus okinawaensis]